jgi:hypothetical protein
MSDELAEGEAEGGPERTGGGVPPVQAVAAITSRVAVITIGRRIGRKR